MRVQNVHNNAKSFGSNIVKLNKFQLAEIGQDVLNASEKVGLKLANEGKGGNFVRIGQRFTPSFDNVQYLEPRMGTQVPGVVLVPTNDVLVTARKQAKTLGEKIKLILGFADYSNVIAKTTKEEDIFEAGREAIKKID